MLKKGLSFTLFAFLLLVGCSAPKEGPLREWSRENGKLKVLSTIAMINDLVKTIGGEEVDALALIRGELDPHSYELVKGDDEKFAAADLIFYNGLGLEHGLSLRQNLEHNPKAVAVAAPLLAHSPEKVLVVDGQYDPHIWMDAALWIETIDPIVEALSTRDAAHASLYQERGKALKETLQAADEEAFRLLQAVPAQKRYLVTSHDAFHYFTRHYLAEPGEKAWQTRCNAPEGLAPEAQLSVSDVIALISHIETFHVAVLFPESNISPDALKKIVNACHEKGLSIRLCHQPLLGDSMGEAPSYIEMLHYNVHVIARELAQ